MTELQALQELKIALQPRIGLEASSNCRNRIPAKDLHSPSAITFVRSRMLYARAALNAKGKVRFGLRHIRRWYESYNCRI